MLKNVGLKIMLLTYTMGAIKSIEKIILIKEKK